MAQSLPPVPSRGAAAGIPGRSSYPSFPAAFGVSRDQNFPSNPFGAQNNRMVRGGRAFGVSGGGVADQDASQALRVAHSLTLTHFPDNSEKRLLPGDMTVVHKGFSKTDFRHSVAAISYLNMVCRDQFRHGEKAFLDNLARTHDPWSGTGYALPDNMRDRTDPHRGQVPGTSPAFDLQSLAANRKAGAVYGRKEYVPSVRVLENWSEYEARGLDTIASDSENAEAYKLSQLGAVEAGTQEKLDAVKDAETARQRVLDVFREYLRTEGAYLTMDGILTLWNMYAPIRRTSWSMPKDDPRSRMNPHSAAFTLARYDHVFNHWGSKVRIGALVGYIFKREIREGPDGSPEYGEFAWTPYFSNERRFPTAADLMFRNIDGSLDFGHFFCLGAMDDVKNVVGSSDATCRQALGLDGTGYDEARNITGKLDKIQVLVRKRV